MAKIPENVLNVLGECRADGNLLYLPSVQLDRKTYTEVNKVLENMGGKWNRKVKAHVFAEDDDVAEMLENVLLTQEVKDLKPQEIRERCQAMRCRSCLPEQWVSNLLCRRALAWTIRFRELSSSFCFREWCLFLRYDITCGTVVQVPMSGMCLY